MALPTALPERIRDKIEIVSGGCWLWLGSRGGKRMEYGRIRMNEPRRMDQAHRVVYEILVGPIPKTRQIHHRCEVACCVNPKHMEIVTNKENCTAPRRVSYQSRMSRCKRGHKLSGSNVYTHKGARHCRTCRREFHRR